MASRTRRTQVATAALVAFTVVAGSCGSDETTTKTSLPDDVVGPDVPGEPPSFHIEGHRGARGLKPENTLPAFETALDIGVATLELDLHLLSDGEVVVWHDKTLGTDKCRFVDGSELPAEGIAVVGLTVDQLVDHQCDLNPDPRRFPEQNNSPTLLAGANYAPMTLDVLFDFVSAYSTSPEKSDVQRAGAAAVEFNIETKRDPADPDAIGDGFDGVNPGRFELALLAAIDRAGVSDRVVIQSFDHRSLWAIRSVDVTVRLAALTSREAPDFAGYAARGVNIWSPNFTAMTTDLVDEAHEAGLLVIPWTVNKADDMVAVLDRGADGLITDRPDIAAALE